MLAPSDNDPKKDRVCWNVHYNDMVAFLVTFSVSSLLLTVYTRLKKKDQVAAHQAAVKYMYSATTF